MTSLKLPKDELKKLALFFILLVILLKIVFRKESLFTNLRVVFGCFWVLVLPGYSITLFWKEKLSFTLRCIIGTAFAAAVVGASSYYLGVVGINLNVQVFFLPVIIILLGGYLYHHNEQRRVRQD